MDRTGKTPEPAYNPGDTVLVAGLKKPYGSFLVKSWEGGIYSGEGCFVKPSERNLEEWTKAAKLLGAVIFKAVVLDVWIGEERRYNWDVSARPLSYRSLFLHPSEK